MLVERIEITETEDERQARVLFRFDPKAITKATPMGRNGIPQAKAKKPSTLRYRPLEVVGREGLEPPKA